MGVLQGNPADAGVATSVRPADDDDETHLGSSLAATMLHEAGDAIIMLNAEQCITWCNRAAERLYDIILPAVRGRRLNEVISCSFQTPPGAPALQHGLATGLVVGRGALVTRAGQEVPVRITVVPPGNPSDPAASFAVIPNDRESDERPPLGERLNFETLLADLSARFCAIREDEIDGEIEVWLRRMVDALEVDRSTFAELKPNQGLVVTHTFAAPGIEPYPLGLVDQALPWLTQEFRAGRTVVLSRIPDDLPEEAVAERRMMTAAGMRAGIGIPVSIGGSLVCVLTFGLFRSPRKWPKDVVTRLHVAAEVFGNAIARRDAKERLEQKQRELAHVGRVAAMGELASVIAHELDQPLTAVVSNAEAVRYLLKSEEPDAAEMDEALQDIIDSAIRVSEIVRRERRLIHKSPLGPERVDLNEAVREIELFLRAEARQYGSRLVLELLPGLPSVTGDPVQLQQVILNLARNGFQAMPGQPPERRELTIRTVSEQAEVVISVSDAGPPVEPALLERMFDPFYTTKANGLGMGLSITKSILDAHHSRIWSERKPDGGVTMCVAIPKESVQV